MNLDHLAEKIKIWGKELGFQKVGICDVDLTEHSALQAWLDAGKLRQKWIYVGME